MARLARIAVVVIVVAASIWLLFTTVFPWIESYMENPSIGTTVTVAGRSPPKQAMFS
ncbi:MAG: hypothetical protein M3252_00270 [Actinomycetota bacterium]|nr:hypothetical protein [Actinomycetota bacterium]